MSAEHHAVSRLDVLDGWRTISVALVILNHVVVFSSIGSTKYLKEFNSYGHLGVLLFFFISGYVISRSLEKEISERGHISYAGFQIRRLFRIVPALIVYLAAIALSGLVGFVDFEFQSLLSTLTFTCNVSGGCTKYIVGHLWSLGVEAQFYLVFPLLLMLAGRHRKYVLALGAALLPFGILALAVAGQIRIASYFSDFLCIATGVAFSQNEDLIRKICLRLPKMLPLFLFTIVIIIVTFAGADRWSTLARYFLLPSLIGFCVMLTVFHTSALASFLSTGPMRRLGMVSYSIYLWQQLATAPFPGAGGGFYVLSITGCVVLALLLFPFFEKPLIDLGVSFARRPRSIISEAESSAP